jgi:hypothetical protein
MAETTVVGFGYKARHGKDSAVAAIIAARGGEFDVRRYALADALKREVNVAAEKFGGMFALFNRLQLGGVITEINASLPNGLPAWVKFESTPDMTDPLCPLGKQRTLLQWWGTELRREKDPFYWVKALDNKLREDAPQFALVPDVRFLNEVFWVKSRGGDTVKVTRYGFPEIESSNHPSETQLANYEFDYEINVLDGNLEELQRDAVVIFDLIVDERRLPGLTQNDFLRETLEAS